MSKDRETESMSLLELLKSKPYNLYLVPNIAQEVERRIETGEDVNARDGRGYSAIWFAVQNRAPAGVVRSLLEAGADVTPRPNGDGQWTLLHDAASIGADPEVFQLLVGAGVDVNAQTAYGRTALSLLVDDHHMLVRDSSGDAEQDQLAYEKAVIGAVRALIDAGANVNAVDSYGTSPISLAQMSRSGRMPTPAFEMLLDSGADLTAKSRVIDGRSVEEVFLVSSLHRQARRYDREYADALIARGANLSSITPENAQILQQEFNNELVLEDRLQRYRNPNFILAACAYLMSDWQAQYPISPESMARLGQLAAQLDQEGILPQSRHAGFIANASRYISSQWQHQMPLPARWVDRIFALRRDVVERTSERVEKITKEYVEFASADSAQKLERVKKDIYSLRKAFEEAPKGNKEDKAAIVACDKMLSSIEKAKGDLFVSTMSTGKSHLSALADQSDLSRRIAGYLSSEDIAKARKLTSKMRDGKGGQVAPDFTDGFVAAGGGGGPSQAEKQSHTIRVRQERASAAKGKVKGPAPKYNNKTSKSHRKRGR